MKFTKTCRPAAIGLLISLCIVLGLLAANPAAAQSDRYTNWTVPLGDNEYTYAELAISLPSAVTTEAVDRKILNYTGGKDIRTSIRLNGNPVDIFLLYPCQKPEAMLDAEGLKSLLASADEGILQANFNETELYIDDKPAIWGMRENSIFAAYQPSLQTAALIVMDGNLDDNVMSDLLYFMKIIVDERITPIPPGYCSDDTAVDEAATISANATAAPEAPVNEAPAVDASASIEPAQIAATEDTPAAVEDTAAVTQTASDPAQSRKEKAEADRAAAMAKLDEAKAAMKK